ncbi:hypothetical protein [Leifsonia sp. NPDC077715]|uniref:hypothetical protein n=1 Tax=Leifsonia sp. NPDC077715 TaxID=3155539 RepID=UPI00343CB428
MIRWGVGRVAAALVVVAAVGLTSGCALLAPPPHPSPTPAAVDAPDAQPAAASYPQLKMRGQTIATGRLVPIAHDPVDDPRAQHPLTGAVRVTVDGEGTIEVRIRPDDPATADLTGLSLLITGTRHDGQPESIQTNQQFELVSALDRTEADGELVMPINGQFTALGDPSWLHSIEESLQGDARVFAAANLTWTLTSPYPGLTVKDSGLIPFARGKVLTEDGVLTTYVPNPYDTITAVTQRFGITQPQFLWLNPWMVQTGSDPELKYGIGVNLDPARR